MPTSLPLTPPRSLHRLATVLASAALLAACQQAPKSHTHPALSAQPARIDAGESVRLSWDAPIGSSLRMDRLTATPPGAVLVRPAQTTVYTLSGPAPSGAPVSTSVTVEVRPAAEPLARLRVEASPVGKPIAASFLGLEQGAGPDSARRRQLLRNLENYGGGPLVLGVKGQAAGACPAVEHLAHTESPRQALRCSAGQPDASAVQTAEMLLDYAQWGAAGVDLPGPLADVPKVAPRYYGMLFFAQFAGAQGAWLAPQVESNAQIKVYALRDARNQTLRIALINREPDRNGTVAVQIPQELREAVVTRLGNSEPLRLAGQTFDGSRDGRPLGTAYGEILEADEDGQLLLSMPAASAALLTLTP